MAQYFKKCSYKTGMIGKWHLSGYDENGVKHGPINYGFDEAMMSEQVDIAGGSYFHPYVNVDSTIEKVLGEEEYLVDRMNYEAVEYIKRNADEPFFLYLSHYAVHTKLDAKKEDVEYFKSKPSDREFNKDDISWTERENPVLAAMLRSVDEGVGMIVDVLKEKNIYDNTIVVFTSDNSGEDRVTQNGHLRAGKSTCYEGGLRIPLVMAWGDKIKHQVCFLPTINLDFYATFADIIGYDIPKEHVTDGISILPILVEGSSDEKFKKRKFYWHYPLDESHFLGGRSSIASRNGKYKYIGFYDNSTHELYDLENDDAKYKGKITFLGGIDVQFNLCTGTRDTIRDEVRSLINNFDAISGKYIITPSNSIMPETPVDNVWYLFEAMKELTTK